MPRRVVKWISSLGKGSAKRASSPARSPARAPAAPKRHPKPAHTLPIDAQLVPSAYRPADRRLVIPTSVSLRRSQQVVVRITSANPAVDLSLTGTVTAIIEGAHALAHVDPGEDGAAVLARLLAAMRGEAEPIKLREPRFRAALPVVVSSEAGNTFMTTTSVSRSGCGLAWSGPAPRLSGGLSLKVGTGRGAVAMRAMVCWVRESQRGMRVGVRFLGGDDGAWSALLTHSKPGAESA
jgi:PilZ domain